MKKGGMENEVTCREIDVKCFSLGGSPERLLRKWNGTKFTNNLYRCLVYQSSFSKIDSSTVITLNYRVLLLTLVMPYNLP